MQIQPHEIHIWVSDLETAPFQDDKVLSMDELARANRFKFPLHRSRFIAGRSLLRKIINLYTNFPADKIVFSYEAKNKPALQLPEETGLQFNLSHSEQMVVYAFANDHAIGIDIEKIREDDHQKLARRYFTAEENKALDAASNRSILFYRIWARKEAVLKATGKGLSQSLSSFSVSVEEDFEKIIINNNQWSLLSLSIEKGFESAVATEQLVNKITYWRFIDQTPEIVKVEER